MIIDDTIINDSDLFEAETDNLQVEEFVGLVDEGE
jgi:hypothetical protein